MEGSTEKKWSIECTRSPRRCLARRNGKFKERRCLGVCKAKRRDENSIADADGAHADRSIQRRLLEYRRKSPKDKEWVGIQWALTAG